MSPFYIQAQILTFTKSHEERIGPLMGAANSIKMYGHNDPVVAFTDDPKKVCFHCSSTSVILIINICKGQTPSLYCISKFIQGPDTNGDGPWT